MSMVEELKRVMGAVMIGNRRSVDRQDLEYSVRVANDFFRDHGQALIEAVADAERMEWVEHQAHCLDWVPDEPIRRVIKADTGSEFESDHSWRDAIDQARAGGDVESPVERMRQKWGTPANWLGLKEGSEGGGA